MRRRFIQVGTELVEVGLDYVPDLPADSGALWGDAHYDIGDARFRTRTQHREYLRSRGLTTMDDYKGEWEKAAKKRAEFYAGRDRSRNRDVAEAYERVRAGHKPRRVEE